MILINKFGDHEEGKHEAKPHFPRLLAKIGEGEEVIISKAGKPAARLIPVEENVVKRDAGSAKGRLIVAEDFDASLCGAFCARTS